MDQTLFTVPILPGQENTAHAFLDELEHQRKEQYAASEQRIGITKEVWAIQQMPQGSNYVVYFEGEDIPRAFQQFAASRDEFDQWFKGQLLATSGVDLNSPPPGPMSEVLSDYEA